MHISARQLSLFAKESDSQSTSVQHFASLELLLTSHSYFSPTIALGFYSSYFYYVQGTMMLVIGQKYTLGSACE